MWEFHLICADVKYGTEKMCWMMSVTENSNDLFARCVHVSSQARTLANTAAALQCECLNLKLWWSYFYDEISASVLPAFKQNTLQLRYKQQMEDNSCILYMWHRVCHGQNIRKTSQYIVIQNNTTKRLLEQHQSQQKHNIVNFIKVVFTAGLLYWITLDITGVPIKL